MLDLNKKQIIEALIFVSDKPLALGEIKQVLEDATDEEINTLIETLNKEYQDTQRSFKITQIAGGYQMVTTPECGPYLKKLYKSRMKEKLTRPSLETLAIKAYKQPATRAEIEAIRGVNVDGVVKTLLEKGLIKICGRKEVVGRPLLYSTTEEFLQHFGLGNISDLPRLEELQVQEGVENDTVPAPQENQ